MLAIVANRADGTNAELADRAGGPVLSPRAALRMLRAGDVALGRLDVRRTLDGVEPGLWTLGRLAGRNVQVLNPPEALLGMHDKLITALRLRRGRVPHPRTGYVPPGGGTVELEPPVVVKPRFGSWGRHVELCSTELELKRCLRRLRDQAWFRRQGALVQELVPPRGRDIRVLVAAGEVVGAIERVAAPGEWRTNIALGGRRRRVEPDAKAQALALQAAAAVGADLAGVDLLPRGRSGYVVLELNGAADFTLDYSLEHDVFQAAIDALLRAVTAQPALVATAS
jgi:RimK family alpha-L-glutamate ligase